MNPNTPFLKLIKLILENPDKYKKMKYWPNHIRDLCEMYNRLDQLTLLQEKIPKKEVWKRYVHEKGNNYHHQKLKEKVEEMRTTTFLVDKK